MLIVTFGYFNNNLTYFTRMAYLTFGSEFTVTENPSPVANDQYKDNMRPLQQYTASL